MAGGRVIRTVMKQVMINGRTTMGRIERKLKKKTRLERLEVYINRLSQFNTNAMHEVGKLSQALRYYADGAVWEGQTFDTHGTQPGSHRTVQVVVWKGELDGPEVARKVLSSLGLDWSKYPRKEPEQRGRESVLNSISEDMRAEREDLAEDDRRYQYGRYSDKGVTPIEDKKE